MSKTFSGKQIINALKKVGYKVERISGGHHVLYNEEENIQVIVPYHKTIKKGTLKSILKKVNLTISSLNDLV